MTDSRGPVLELRQYTLHAGQRDVLIDLFEREFLEPQEEVGMSVPGHFRDLDDPDRFVWVRGFTDMEARRQALSAFYDGPVWAAHREAANATMAEFDDVLLLRPVAPGAGFSSDGDGRPSVGAAVPSALVVASVFPARTDDLVDLLTDRVEPLLAATGSNRLALLETEPAENSFPRLPVREGESVVVRFSRFDSPEAHAAHLERLDREPLWPQARAELAARLAGAVQHLRLQPAARSLLR
jgi:quinol monooxygenase YgiN